MENRESKYEEQIVEVLKIVKGPSFAEMTDLITGGYISSFDLIKLVSEIEKNFKIKIPLEKIELDAFNSVDSIGNLIDENLR